MLSYDDGMWFLEIWDKAELIARARSGHAPPNCFRELGSKVKGSLEKSGKLD